MHCIPSYSPLILDPIDLVLLWVASAAGQAVGNNVARFTSQRVTGTGCAILSSVVYAGGMATTAVRWNGH